MLALVAITLTAGAAVASGSGDRGGPASARAGTDPFAGHVGTTGGFTAGGSDANGGTTTTGQQGWEGHQENDGRHDQHGGQGGQGQGQGEGVTGLGNNGSANSGSGSASQGDVDSAGAGSGASSGSGGVTESGTGTTSAPAEVPAAAASGPAPDAAAAAPPSQPTDASVAAGVAPGATTDFAPVPDAAPVTPTATPAPSGLQGLADLPVLGSVGSIANQVTDGPSAARRLLSTGTGRSVAVIVALLVAIALFLAVHRRTDRGDRKLAAAPRGPEVARFR